MDDIAKNHHTREAWDRVTEEVRQAVVRADVHAAHTVVLVPYAQLIPVARAAWARSAKARGANALFVPRFETSMNWTRSLGGFQATGHDLRMDVARDALTAGRLLDSAGLDGSSAALAGRLVEAASSLAKLAAAVAPAERSAWGVRLSALLLDQPAAPALEVEARIGQVALAWAANSAYPTDLLFSARVGLLVFLQGLQMEPQHETLRASWADKTVVLRLEQTASQGTVPLHQALDLEDEAERAAACVMSHLAQGRSPVALVAQDRIVTRRVRALLAESGVAVRDETGWTLSTTRAAASVVGLVRASAWDASTDAVLDWAKNASAFDTQAMAQLEAALRRAGVRDWRQVALLDGVTQQIADVLATLQLSRPLSAWLDALRNALVQAGQWQPLLEDAAGQAVLDALRLRDGDAAEFADFSARMGQSAFLAWASQALEADIFVPPHPARAQVLILPLSQLLGRAVAAVVFPGCDEQRLPASPEPPGMWTPAQRVVLGLPSREQLAAMTRAAWHYALQFPHVDLLWRSSEGGEHLMPSAFIQELLLDSPVHAADPRSIRALVPIPGHMPRPQGESLPLALLSASSYEDLRRCPYRFFGLRLLGLQESDELDTDLGKRDFGNWLHLVLRHFHEALLAEPLLELQQRSTLLDAAALRATADMGLAENEFLPFAASWPKVRAAYLHWLAGHEADGASFAQAEANRQMPLGRITLAGRIDRIDRLADGSALVIDYKTEARGKTVERLKNPAEDTQLAFYAALLEDDTLSALYLNIGESLSTQAYVQKDIVELRDQLLQGIQDDLQRIAEGARLPAIGEGSACEYCAARGLCRKDFWETDGGVVGMSADV